MDILKKMYRVGVILFLLSLWGYPISYFWARNSEAYEVAVSYAKKEEVILKQTGRINSVEMRGFFGTTLMYRGPYGEARFPLDIYGEAKKVSVTVSLVREVGIWEVKSFEVL